MDKNASAGRAALCGLALVVALCGYDVAFAAPMALQVPAMTDVPNAFAGDRVQLAQLSPIRVTPFRWFATKTEDGSLVISGYVPSAGIKARLFALAGARALDATTIADGADETFEADAQTALALLSLLDKGEAELSGTAWGVSGMVADAEKASSIRKLLTEAGLAEKNWKLDLTLPEPIAGSANDTTQTQVASGPADAAEAPAIKQASAASAAEPAAARAAPFSFAVLWQNGRWIIGGNAPIEPFQRLVDAHLHAKTLGRLTIAPAPEGFGSAALAGLDLLSMLESGHLRFDGSIRSLAGVAKDQATADKVNAGLQSAGFTGAVAVAAQQLQSAEAKQETPNETSSSEVAADNIAVVETPAATEAPSADTATSEANHVGKPAQPSTDAEPELAGAAAAKVEAPPPVPAVELPLPSMHPFRWQAESQANGAINFSGYSPTDALKSYLGVKSHGGKDETVLAGGAPDGFAADVVAGLAALSDLDSGRLVFDGTNWTLNGSAKDDAGKSAILTALGSRADVWTVAIATPEPPPAPAPRPEPPAPVDRGASDYVFTAEKRADSGLVLGGDVPAAATRAFLGVISGNAPTDVLTVRPGAPPDFVVAATAGVRALAGLDSGTLIYRHFAWSFSGKSASAPARAAAQSQLASLSNSADWSIDIVSPTPLEMCTSDVSAFDARNAILFEAGSAHIAKESFPALDEIAAALKQCPEAYVHVEGHTDSDGDDQSNLILSVARAEAVVDKMIELGIGEARLYAIGYGESLPVAANDTNAGKRKNRRIVFTVSDNPG